MFNTIDQVKINGRNKAFGGYIYAVDLDVGILDKPTTLSIQFVNESGQYQEPELSVEKPYKISIGNIIVGNFYAVSFEDSKTSQGRILTVNFEDGSHILDRIYVGLYKRMGDHTTNTPGLLIVGREMHPCDQNQDGVFNQDDADLIAWNQEDPCELKCPNSEDQSEPVIDKCVEREISEIFEVKYNFDDLLDALAGQTVNSDTARTVNLVVPNDLETGVHNVQLTLPEVKKNLNSSPFNRIKIKNRPQNTNPAFFKDYTGSLREVLKNWCADFGWSFFWEDDALNFVDTKARPKVNLKAFSNLESVSHGKTLEGTVGRGFSTYYANPGIKAETECKKSQNLLLTCLSLRDLFGDYYKPSWAAVKYRQDDYSSIGEATVLSPPIPDPANSDPNDQITYRDDFFRTGIPIETFEVSVVLSHYSQTLRDLYNLWNVYGIKTDALANAAKNKWADRLGQIKILSVLSKNYNDKKFTKIKGGEPDANGKVNGKSLIDDETKKKMQALGGYVIVALKNRQEERPLGMMSKQFEAEQRLANDFMGQHWYRAYTAPPYQNPQFYPNAEYFGALSANIGDLPFSSFNHTHGSNVSKITSSFISRQKNDYRQYGPMKFAGNFTSNIAKKNVRSMVYFNRNADSYWAPNNGGVVEISSVFSRYEKYAIEEVSLKDADESLIRTLVTENRIQLVPTEFFENVALYIVYPSPSAAGISVSSEITDHPVEEKKQHLEGVEPYAFSTGGLLNNKCVKYRIEGLDIFTPQGASVQFTEQGDRFTWKTRQPTDAEFDKPVYKVLVQSTETNRGIIPKTQSSLVLAAPTSAKRVEYGFHQVDKDSSLLLNKLSTDCVIPESELTAIHNTVSKNLNFSVAQPFESYQYRIYGLQISTPVSIKDGLESLKVRVTENGISTDIVMSNNLFTPPSQDYIYKALQLGLHKYINASPTSI